MKVAIYADSSGQPGDLRNAGSASTPVVAGWKEISITSTPVTAGTAYWLACISDSRCMCYIASGGTGRYKSASYSGFTFPGSAGSGFSSWTGYHLTAGWANITLPAPPATPVIVTPKTTVTFEWSATSGATKYWLQVNTASDFTGTSMFDAEVSATSQDVALFVGTTYHWRVKAGNAGGWSGWSSTASVTP